MITSKLPVNVSRSHSLLHCSVRSYCKAKPLVCEISKPISVTILGAASKLGQTVALLLKQSPVVEILKLYDTSAKTCGIAMDLSHIDTNTQVLAYTGIELLKDAVTDSQIVVYCGVQPIRPQEDEKQQFSKNADGVRLAAMHLSEFNPQAIFCISGSPINSLIPMVSQEYKKANVYDSRKIIGITNLASSRANSIVGDYLNKDPNTILCPIVGGFCPLSLVAVLSQVRPKTEIPQQAADGLQVKIATADVEIIHKKSLGNEGPIVVSPAFAISNFVNSMARALKGDKTRVECAYVRQVGHIGKFLPYMLSIVKLGRHGVESSHMPALNDVECKLLEKAAWHIRGCIALGESYVTGEIIRTRRRCPDNEVCCPLVETDKKEQTTDSKDKTSGKKEEDGKMQTKSEEKTQTKPDGKEQIEADKKDVQNIKQATAKV